MSAGHAAGPDQPWGEVWDRRDVVDREREQPPCVAAVAATLIGAILGGLGGMRFHRKVDQTGLGR